MEETTGSQYYLVGILEFSDIEWDIQKAATNLEKHGIAFDDVALMLRDTKRIEYRPPQEHQSELRWQTTGCSDQTIITVIYTWREGNVRIISARKASRRERREYRSSAPL